MSHQDPIGFDPSLLHELDVRDMIRQGEHPLDAILAATDALPTGHILHLRSPFEPVPLHRVMHDRGFDHHGAMFQPDDWSTWFWRRDAPPTARAIPLAQAPTPIAADIVDLRALVPPEPMARVLAMVDRDPAPFRVALPRFPAPLAPILEGLGWTAVVEEELDDGSLILRLARAGP